MEVEASVTVGGDEGSVLGVETLVHVGRVRFKCDGRGVAWNGNHHLLVFASAQSTM